MNKNFNMYLVANTLLMISSNTLQFLLALFVLHETGSATLFSTMLSVIIIPRLLVTPCAGAWGDKYDRKKLMQVYFAAYSVLYGSFALLIYSITACRIELVFVFVMAIEVIETMYTSVNSSMIPMLVEKKDIGSATSYTMIGESVSSIFAPILGAVLLEWLDVFVSIASLAAINFTAFIFYCFVKLKRVERCEEQDDKNSFALMKDTFGIILNSSLLKRIVALAPLVNFFLAPLLGVTYVYLLNEILNVSSYKFGMCESLCGVAVIFGGIISARVLKSSSFSKVLRFAVAGIALAMLVQLICVLAIGDKGALFYCALAIMFVMNIMLAIMNASTSTLFKQQIPLEHMSRVASVINLLATVILPVGQVMYGVMADKVAIAVSFAVSVIGMVIVYTLCQGFKED